MRRFNDPVEVRSSASGPHREPEAFIWRGRLYVVRDVLAQWRERRAWWRDVAVDAGPGVHPAELGSGVGSGVGTGAVARGAAPTTLVAAAQEQQVWRVEASRGWSFAPGVYDLARAESPSGEQWLLVRVAD